MSVDYLYPSGDNIMDGFIKLLSTMLKLLGFIVISVLPFYIFSWAIDNTDKSKIAGLLYYFFFAFFVAVGLFGVTLVIFPIHLIFSNSALGFLVQFGTCLLFTLCVFFFYSRR